MSDSESTMSRTQLHNGIRGIYSRMHKIMSLRRRKEEKARIEISAPFNFQKVSMDLAGISADELSLLKEQAVASRIGIADPENDTGRPTLLKSTSGPIVSVVPSAPYMIEGPMGRSTF